MASSNRRVLRRLLWLCGLVLCPTSGQAQNTCVAPPAGQDLNLVKAYAYSPGTQAEVPLGGGALVLSGADQVTGQSQGGAYFVYDGAPEIAADHGSVALYPTLPNISASLSIAPSGPAASMLGEDTPLLDCSWTTDSIRKVASWP